MSINQTIFDALMNSTISRDDLISLSNAAETLKRLGLTTLSVMEVSESAMRAVYSLGSCENIMSMGNALEKFKRENPAEISNHDSHPNAAYPYNGITWKNKITLIKKMKEQFQFCLIDAKHCCEALYDEKNMEHVKARGY